jgi:hypothetical protein
VPPDAKPTTDAGPAAAYSGERARRGLGLGAGEGAEIGWFAAEAGASVRVPTADIGSAHEGSDIAERPGI